MIWEVIVEHISGNVWSLLSLVVTTVSGLVIVPKIVKSIQTYKYFQSLPGEPDFSILFGNLHKLPKDPEGRIAYGRYNMETYNPRFNRVWIGPLKPVLVVYHPETVKIILKSSAPKSRGFGHIYELLEPWIGEGLIVSNGPTWYRSRRLITPAFHFDILKPYMDVYNCAADKLVKKLEPYALSGEKLDVYPLVLLCTLEVILKCAMSYDVDVQGQGHDPYASATRELSEVFAERARSPWFWSEFIFKLSAKGHKFFQKADYVHGVAEKIIGQRKEQLEKEGTPKGRCLDLIDILLMARDEEGQPMTTQQIRNEVDTFMFAGHDTTASAIMWFLYCLAKHTEYQVKIQEEIDQLIEGRDTDHMQWSDLSQLPIFSLAMKESMRLFPPVPFIQRTMNEETVMEGYTFKTGTCVTIAFMHLHRNPTVWENPDEFRPERFLPENMKDRDPFSYVPFSAGSRNCIGQHFATDEIKVIMCRILARYTVKLIPEQPAPIRYAQATLQSQNGMWLQLIPRSGGSAQQI